MNLAMVAEHPNLPHLLQPVLDHVIEELSEMDPPEPCEDAISRRAAIGAINNKKIAVGDYLTSSWVGFEFAIEEIERLPSATP